MLLIITIHVALILCCDQLMFKPLSNAYCREYVSNTIIINVTHEFYFFPTDCDQRVLVRLDIECDRDTTPHILTRKLALAPNFTPVTEPL